MFSLHKKELHMNEHYIFVYGSLKAGFGNHRFLTDSEFIGSFKTLDRDFIMVSLGSFPAVCFDKHEGGCQIEGEVYRVDDETLADLDRLEGNGSLYTRKLVPIEGMTENNGQAWIYLFSNSNDLFSFMQTRNSSRIQMNDFKSLVWTK